jgi:pyruvate/2-oxoglutarate/acetoin dehydrogenase E1 component
MTTVLESLNTALHHLLDSDKRVLILGEDVLDPYGGAFKVTRGLSTKFADQVLTTPISEAGMVGIAAGMAIRGMRPVVEIMFGDFITLITDQLVNHITKFRWMYNDQVSVPMVIRTPMGGRRGYGPTHSQTLEKIFLGIPGLHILAPCDLGDPGQLLTDAVLVDDEPVLFIENKLLYLAHIQDATTLIDFNLVSSPSLKDIDYAPVYTLTIRDAPPPAITLVAYGYMATLAREAVWTLAFEHEIFSQLVILTQLAPLAAEPIFTSLQHTGRLLVVEEGTLAMGWGAEVLARASEMLGSNIQATRRIAARQLPIPASEPLEAVVLPELDEIIKAVKMMVI